MHAKAERARVAALRGRVRTQAGARGTRQTQRDFVDRPSEDPRLIGAGKRLDAVTSAELLESSLEIGLDGAAGEAEGRCDLRVGLAHGNPTQNLVLAAGEAALLELLCEEDIVVLPQTGADDP